MYVVSQVQSSDGLGGSRTQAYQYGGLKAEQGTGRGLLGFAWQQVFDAGTGISTRTEFNQVFPLVGSPRQVVRSLGAQVLGQSVLDYGYVGYPGGGTGLSPGRWYRVFNAQSRELTWDLTGAFVGGTRTTHSEIDDYNNIGRVLVESLDGSGNFIGFSTLTVNQYANDPGQWNLGRLLRSQVTHVKP
jgi:hypothetical protein